MGSYPEMGLGHTFLFFWSNMVEKNLDTCSIVYKGQLKIRTSPVPYFYKMLHSTVPLLSLNVLPNHSLSLMNLKPKKFLTPDYFFKKSVYKMLKATISKNLWAIQKNTCRGGLTDQGESTNFSKKLKFFEGESSKSSRGTPPLASPPPSA